ncbi:hypothetical protein [Lysobacter sp. HA35]
MTEPDAPVGFGDTVTILETADTVGAGIAGHEGEVYGFTTPSGTGVDVVGSLAEDFAINVYVESLGRDFWLDPSAVQLVSRPDVMEFGAAGKTIRVTRTADGYVEEIVGKRPWWKFW